MEEIISEERRGRLFQWSKGNPQPPVVLEVWPTFRCNLSCLFCDYRKKREKKDRLADYKLELSDKRWCEIIKEASKIGVKAVRIAGGGEPLVRNQLTLKLIKLIKNSKMWGLLTTNGSLFTEEVIKTLVKYEWDRIEVSIDGPKARIHDYLRNCKGCFKKTINNIKKITYYKKIYGKEKPEIFFSTIITNLTYDKIEDFMKLGSEIGANGIGLLQLIVKTPESKSLALQEDQWKELYRNLIKSKKKEKEYGVSLGIEGLLQSKFFEKKKKKNTESPNVEDKSLKFLSLPCYEPWYYLQIIADGRVSPCCTCFVNQDNRSVKDESIMSMWSHPHVENIRNHIFSGDLLPQCKECSQQPWLIFKKYRIMRELAEHFYQLEPENRKEIIKIGKFLERVSNERPRFLRV